MGCSVVCLVNVVDGYKTRTILVIKTKYLRRLLMTTHVDDDDDDG